MSGIIADAVLRHRLGLEDRQRKPVQGVFTRVPRSCTDVIDIRTPPTLLSLGSPANSHLVCVVLSRHQKQSPAARVSQLPPADLGASGGLEILSDRTTRTHRVAGAIRIRITLSGAACAIALDPAGITRSTLRTAIIRARAIVRHDRPHREFSCTAIDSRRLLRFYKFAADYFGEHQDQLQANICREACEAIARAHRRAGLGEGGRGR